MVIDKTHFEFHSHPRAAVAIAEGQAMGRKIALAQ